MPELQITSNMKLMRSRVSPMLAIGISILILSGCYYDKEAILYPDSANCTPVANPSFTSDILPLINAKCNMCHGGSSPSAGIKLDTHTEVVKYANTGSLMGSINHASGYSAMPKNASKMSACQIDKIQAWINSGMPNN